MADLPPKTLKTQLVHLDNNLKQIERKRFAGIQRAPGSLPVLEAFQEFLDKESQKAKKRLMQATLLFTAIIIAAVAAGGTFIYLQAKRSAADYSALAAKTGELESANKASSASISELEALLNTNTEQQKNLQSAHANITDIVNNDSKLIEDLQQTIKNLEEENKSLKADITKFIVDWHTITQKVDSIAATQTTLLAKSQAAPAKPANTPEPTADLKQTADPKTTVSPAQPSTELQSTDETSAKSASIKLLIVPKGRESGIRWRLPRIHQK